MRQPAANQLHVLGGELLGLAFCALPFALPGVRKTEAQARARAPLTWRCGGSAARPCPAR